MSEAAGNIIDFYSSASGLPLIVLLVMTAIAVGAIIAFIQSRNAANRLIAENKKHNEQMAKRLATMQLLIEQKEPELEFDTSDSLLRQLKPEFNQLSELIRSLRDETTKLSENVGEQQLISEAIEMARAGSKRADIVNKTGLTAEQADAIVRFHGPKQPSDKKEIAQEDGALET
ncbi:MAG: hypothetical protein VW981_07670 [Rhodobiaceae bacterium]